MKKNITLERHREIGRYLKDLNQALCGLLVEFASATGKTSKISRAIAGMQGQLTKLRSEAEEVMARDYPAEWDTHIYYGNGRHQGMA